MRYLKYILVFLLWNMVSSLYSQSCEGVLKTAEKMYDDGKIELVYPTMKDCLKHGFSNEEKARAYRLLIQTYLFDDKFDSATFFMMELLKINPEFKAGDDEIEELQELFSEYRTGQFISFGIFGGGNFSNTNLMDVYSLQSSQTTNPKYSSGGLATQFGIYFIRHLEYNLDIILSPSFQQVKKTENDLFGTTMTQQFTEKQNRFFLPVAISWSYPINNYYPFIKIGLGSSYLLNSSISAIRDYSDNSHNTIEDENIAVTDYRNSFDFSFNLGAGLKYKVKRGFLLIDISYYKGLNQQVSDEERYMNDELIYKYYYLDNDYKLNHWNISLGYTYPIYKTKKK